MKKGIILITVIGIFVVITLLALATMSVMRQQGKMTEHKIKKIRAFYAAHAGVVYAFEGIGDGTITDGVPASFNIGNGIQGYPSGGLIVNITYTDNNLGPGGTDPVVVTVNY